LIFSCVSDKKNYSGEVTFYEEVVPEVKIFLN